MVIFGGKLVILGNFRNGQNASLELISESSYTSVGNLRPFWSPRPSFPLYPSPQARTYLDYNYNEVNIGLLLFAGCQVKNAYRAINKEEKSMRMMAANTTTRLHHLPTPL